MSEAPKLNEELEANYRDLHEAGESWENLAQRNIDPAVAAWCRAQAAAEGPKKAAPAKRRSKANAEQSEA